MPMVPSSKNKAASPALDGDRVTVADHVSVADHVAGADQAAVTVGKVGYAADKEDLLKRLRRIEGQIRGLQRMVTEDTYCIDVLTQISAATKALQAVALQLLDE